MLWRAYVCHNVVVNLASLSFFMISDLGHRSLRRYSVYTAVFFSRYLGTHECMNCGSPFTMDTFTINTFTIDTFAMNTFTMDIFTMDAFTMDTFTYRGMAGR